MDSSRLHRVRGPPSHIALFRRMCVEERNWIEATEFEDAIASVNLLPGPASTQLAIFCAWRLRRTVGAILGGVCFISPGLVVILVLSAVFLAHHPLTGSSARRQAQVRPFRRWHLAPQAGSCRRVGSASELRGASELAGSSMV